LLGDERIAWRDRTLWNALWILDHLLDPPRVDKALSGLRERVNRRIFRDLSAHGPASYAPLPELDGRDPVAFRRTALRANMPVVLRGAAKEWPCGHWTPQTLAARFPDEEVLLIDADPDSVPRENFSNRPTTLREVVDDMMSGGLDYARFNPLLQNHPELLHDLDMKWLRSLIHRVRGGVNYQLFMGGAGTATAMHNALSNNLFVQVHGRKKWFIFPPTMSPAMDPPMLRAPYFFSKVDPNAREGAAAFAPGYEVVLEPGDVLFNPAFYWHHVENLTHTIGIGFRWTSPLSVAQTSLTQGLLTAMATNPPVWFAARNLSNFAKIFAKTER